ncbi:DNA-cytosine methyltransferase [Butyrivibrio proteoclasticus B316]|uniref:DNA (cytosine-5-)-methyltransferase n=1 Tax=Butyrivibrio proteoclasticus (strain ATCC 51982 / DSM 14932 / B316) TaxID=515622 RepID=E0RXS2_BUTPB|nr:DNA cytosine methyltransferase [Butyrivibrio proteoclasticus]ADL34648.1 DNA-cytosine methyltransferase [Butyrivibrio proteoclasticus B316]
MIRLATAFSGIGAIEHALNRMGLENEIVFACDNGDVNILTKDVDTDIDEIETELESLSELIEEISINDNVEDLYKNQLEGMLRASMTEFHEVDEQLNNVEEKDNELLKYTTTELLDSNVLKANRKKEYSKRLAELGKGSFANKRLEEFLLLLAFSNDFRDNNDLLEKAGLTQSVTELLERFENDNGRKLIRRVIDLAQRTSMLHEKINYLRVQRKLDSFGEDWKARKKYVDSLYEGLEKRNKVKASYTANYDIKEDDFHWNIAFLDGKQYAGKVDLFVGGSPCQSFSFVGKQRGLDDTRGTLFYEYARLIDEIRPKVFIYENVRAVTSHDGGKTWKKMQQVFSELDYSFSWKVLNARDYGVPQNRERLFVVGFRNDLDLDVEFSFPQAIELEKKMQDFLLDNAPGGYFLPEKGVDFVTSEKNLSKRFTQIDGEVQLCQKKNQQFNWHGDFVFQSEEDAEKNHIPDLEKYYLSEKVRKYVLSTGTKNFYSKPETDLEVARPLLTTMHKMHRAGVDNYVTTDGRLRKLTPRECLRLMGFSDSFKIVVSDTSMYQQAGNSIVVDVLIHIMEQILSSYPELND